MAALMVAGGVAASSLVSSLVTGAKGKKAAKKNTAQAVNMVGPVTPIDDITDIRNPEMAGISNIDEVADYTPTQGEVDLSAASKGLLEDTDPLRKQTIARALQVMMGGATPEALGPVVAAKRSSIQGNQAKGRAELESRLAAQGLQGSSVGNAALENIDRETSQMLTGADVSEIERLNTIGEQLGFGPVLETGMSGLKTGADLSSRGKLATEQMQLDRNKTIASLNLDRDKTLATLGVARDTSVAELNLNRSSRIAQLNLERDLGRAGIQAGLNKSYENSSVAETNAGVSSGQMLSLLLADYLKKNKGTTGYTGDGID